uniref:Neur_chan_LBD domain-containing protein n=1 Tax=Caenorhabditis tropicalis TaxID=1561998 RepID=A0A1I7UA26_9PELO
MEWSMARDYMRCHPLFNVLFESNDYDLEVWTPKTFNVDEKSRLPAEILLLPEAAKVFEQFRKKRENSNILRTNTIFHWEIIESEEMVTCYYRHIRMTETEYVNCEP